MLWSQVLAHIREVAQGAATALLFDKHVDDRRVAKAGAARVCRYLAAFAWELCAKLTAPVTDSTALKSLLPASEAEWVATQRSRPLVLLGSLRRELHTQYRVGNLPRHLHRKLEEDIRQLDLVVGSMERLFSSPLPPTMSRHIVRVLQLWLVGFPFVLAGTSTRQTHTAPPMLSPLSAFAHLRSRRVPVFAVAPISVAIWVFATSYAFVGIDEVGVQVEQPFEIVPMNAITNLILVNLEETFVKVPPGVFD